MTAHKEEAEELDVRTLWQHEGLDFTPWLAKNLKLLGKAIDMKLELVQEEKQIDSLYLDILAKDAETGALVAIENQLEWSDIDHLGRLLIYAAGSDARVAIWVAPDFYRHHARVLHRLNEWTHEDVRFYCVKVELEKGEDDSEPKPRFRKVLYPGGWDEDATLPPLTPSPEAQKHQDFFQPLIAEMLPSDFADKAVQRFNHTDRSFPSRVDPRVRYIVSLEGRNDAWVSFHIWMASKEEANRIFNKLYADHKAIESSIDAGPCPDWHWNRYNSYFFSSISVRRDGSIDDPPEKLKEIRAWMLDLLPKFQEVFDPRVEEMFAERED